ncbi:hypothetical protein DY000_02001924 [Brassica cretica]|uniref:Uncharacterized protein n=1 Tax=Brassica cretica TaxID=69181 RepID=A0ABQ7BV46_BRACR|nr:hypothetical protein DY000_02001924 [Brassica cretica]
MGNATTRIPYRSRPINCIPSSQVTIEKIQGGIDLRFFKMKIRLILSKEDSFRSLPSNDYLEGYNEDTVGLGGSIDSIGESRGWMVQKGMHTRQCAPWLIYQIINGLERVVEGSTEAKRIHVVAMAFKVGVRFPYRSRLIVFIPLKFSISGVVIE